MNDSTVKKIGCAEKFQSLDRLPREVLVDDAREDHSETQFSHVLCAECLGKKHSDSGD